MKRYLIIIAFLATSGFCFGQQITRAEYYIGTDPGFGMATPVPVLSSGDNITLSFTASMQALAEGFHFINIRVQDDLGNWGFPVQRIFYVFKRQLIADRKISGIEYFIDTDPGFGLATPVTVSSPGSSIALEFTALTESFLEGFHYLNIRARDSLGRWSQPIQRIFYVFKSRSAADRDITGVEYFIDTDPGFGEATPVDVPSSGNEITINFDADLSSLSDGDHVIYVRCKDALNRWGQMYSQSFSFTITDVGEIKIESLFKLYPNPSNGDFYLEFSKEPHSPIKLYIDDLNGKRVYEGEYYSRINLLNFNLKAGLYLLNLEQEDKSFNQKIVIK